ncbi:type II secretion system F family protein [Yoonia sediminilitoris]|nr:type II secretion system F family protein [Yoonia sediminilitoris]
MPLYRYSARRLTGEKVTGEDAAGSVAALSSQLSGEGLLLVDAKPVGSRLSWSIGRGGTVKLGALMTFIRELRALISAGMPVARALSHLEDRKDDPVLAAAVASVRTRVERGAALDAAMAEHPLVFDRLTQATVRAGTASGNLDGALERLLSFLAIRHQLQRKIRQAMIYPIFLLVLLAVVLAVLMLFVLPRFSDLYLEFGADLPLPTQILMTAVEVAPVVIPALVLGVVGVILLGRFWLRVPSRRMVFDRLRLALPVSGQVRRNLGLVQVSFMMAMLLSAGMTLREALRMTADSLSNADQQTRLAQVGEAINQGQSLRDSLAQTGLYPALSQSLLAAGEQAGDLDRMFAEVAALHQEALDDRLGRVIALIEPAMMLLVGIVLGGVIVAVYLPIFGISTVVQ